MVISSPCLTDIKNWLVQSKRLLNVQEIYSVRDSNKDHAIMVFMAENGKDSFRFRGTVHHLQEKKPLP
ncbi:hypothetical protein Tco_0628430 [Tanacetum coccineum]|uniref:Uncharacterized protein n=1 Tax=Tanacetum coccineum TaxID=301880 RepID=A0ABQ4WQG4_9ASTR